MQDTVTEVDKSASKKTIKIDDFNELLESTRSLVNQLDTVGRCKQLQDALFVAAQFGHEYRGETWGLQLNRVKSVLKRFNEFKKR